MVRHIFLWKVAKGADPAEIIRILTELHHMSSYVIFGPPHQRV
jgi:hypothetical protein